MQHGFTSVPFKAESGLKQVNGVAKFSAAGVVLEFESKLFGIIGGGVKEARLPLGEILDVKFRKGVFRRGARIEIRLRSFSRLAELPNTEGKLVLKLIADDFERAQDAVAKLEKDLIEHVESLPPPHTPIGELLAEQDDDDEEVTRL
jgi:hypothetical protein